MTVQRGICSAVPREKFNILRRNGRCTLLFSAAFRVSFSGKGSGFFFQAKAAILRKAEAIPSGTSGGGRAFRKNSSGEYFIFSQ